MMQSFKCLMAAFAVFILTGLPVTAQTEPAGNNNIVKKDPLPYKILNSGRQLTFKASHNIRSLMIWTSGGHRVLEQQDINATSFSYTIPSSVNERIFFVMLVLENGKVYTRKVGI
jgi:hypothetical protein